MGNRRGVNWDAVSRKEKSGPRRKPFQEHSRDHTSLHQHPLAVTKNDLRRMLTEAVKNTRPKDG